MILFSTLRVVSILKKLDLVVTIGDCKFNPNQSTEYKKLKVVIFISILILFTISGTTNVVKFKLFNDKFTIFKLL